MSIKTGKKRIEYIDALRAFALFGVIMVHVNQMYSFYNELNDFSYFTATGLRLRQIVFWLFDDKSRTIFSTLFGISFYLILRNPSYTNRKFLWRCILLMCFGLFDKLFSSGDILFWYGINGAILSFLPVRRLRPRILLLIALALFLFSLIDLSPYLSTSFPIRYPADTTLAKIMSYPMIDVVVSDIFGRLCIDSTMTLSCFVFGFYLGKSGIIDNIGRYTSLRNCLLTAILFLAGLVVFRLSGYHPAVWCFSVVAGAVALSLNFISFFNHFPRRLSPLTRYGRLGLTNYSSQYIMGTIMVLYIALPQKISIEYIFLMGIAMFILQSAFSWFWTSHFRYGPLEWLWRIATNLSYEPPLRAETNNKTTGHKIAILTSGILPVPAVQGGAVENLIDFYLTYNDRHRLHDITIYSVYHPNVVKHSAHTSSINNYRYIDTISLTAKVKRMVREWIRPKGDFYNNFIEFFFEEACKDMRRQQYDCIILENRPGYAKKLAERGFRNIVLHLHNDLLNDTTLHHQQIFNSLNRILTVSDYIRSRVSTIEQSDKIVTIHNGIDLSRFSHETSSALSRTDIGFAPDDFVLVYSGRINKDKGIAELISAMLLLQDIPSIKLLVIGSTFFGNAANEDDFVRTLKNKAQALEGRIVFTGFVAYDRMPDYLRLSDVAIIPSVWDDPFPTTVLEAQAMGLPIICSNRGGIPEEVEKDNAIIVSTENRYIEALAEAICQLYYSPQQRADMTKASLRHSALFDKDRFARDFFNALEPIF